MTVTEGKPCRLLVSPYLKILKTCNFQSIIKLSPLKFQSFVSWNSRGKSLFRCVFRWPFQLPTVKIPRPSRESSNNQRYITPTGGSTDDFWPVGKESTSTDPFKVCIKPYMVLVLVIGVVVLIHKTSSTSTGYHSPTKHLVPCTTDFPRCMDLCCAWNSTRLEYLLSQWKHDI